MPQNLSHVYDAGEVIIPDRPVELSRILATQLQGEKVMMSVFDEGCMGMYNAIIPNPLLHPAGLYKERLSQSDMCAYMDEASDAEAQQVRHWLDDTRITFVTGPYPSIDLIDDQIRDQCKVYIVAVRMADRFGSITIGNQYQLGLMQLTPASDLVEGLLNNVERPPVHDVASGEILYEGRALPRFNEVDERAGLDVLVTNRIWTAMGLEPETTLHDVRWGEVYQGPEGAGGEVNDFVWLFMISGAASPNHFADGYRSAVSECQPPMFFRRGGGTLKGISKPGEIVWSRVFVQDDALHMDIGRGGAVSLPQDEVERRWQATTPG